MNTLRHALVALALIVPSAGCAVEQVDEDIDDAPSAFITTNAITTNAITTNAITTNAITTNAITTNAITTNAITTNGALAPLLNALSDVSPTGDASRTIFHYLINCAFAPSQSVSYSYTDSQGTLQTVTETGNIGLAPSWASGPLDPEGQEYVSACLAARVNYYGVTVDISVRGDVDVLIENTSQAELGQYSYVEGGFWGNLFSPTPYMRSCYRGENVAHSRSKLRECAAGHLNADGTVSQCGPLQIVGECKTVCKRLLKNGGYYTACRGPTDSDDRESIDVITVGLK